MDPGLSNHELISCGTWYRSQALRRARVKYVNHPIGNCIQVKYEAILFDFDGVLGDTMHDNYRAWSQAFRDHGVVLEQGEYFPLEGLSIKMVAETILERRGLSLALAPVVAAAKEQYYLEDNQFCFFPGALELVAELRAGYLLGVVSGGGIGRLCRSAGTGFLDQFQVVITGDSVKRPKPSPEPYLLAAEALSVPPGACLVVENAPLGIQAAKSAGMVCVAVCSTLAAENLQGADFIVPDLQSVRHFLMTLS